MAARSRSRHAPVHRTSLRRLSRAADPAVRLFVLSGGALATAFLLALLYLRFATAIAADGYDLHTLEARRDELRRENQLLDVQARRLGAPGRIETEAKRLGLLKTSPSLYLPAGPVIAGSR